MQEAVKPPTGRSMTVQQADSLVSLLGEAQKGHVELQMLSLITNERNPDYLAGFPHGMNAQGFC